MTAPPALGCGAATPVVSLTTVVILIFAGAVAASHVLRVDMAYSTRRPGVLLNVVVQDPLYALEIQVHSSGLLDLNESAA